MSGSSKRNTLKGMVSNGGNKLPWLKSSSFSEEEVEFDENLSDEDQNSEYTDVSSAIDESMKSVEFISISHISRPKKSSSNRCRKTNTSKKDNKNVKEAKSTNVTSTSSKKILSSVNASWQDHQTSLSEKRRSKRTAKTTQTAPKRLIRSCRKKIKSLNEDILSSMVFDNSAPTDSRKKKYSQQSTGISSVPKPRQPVKRKNVHRRNSQFMFPSSDEESYKSSKKSRSILSSFSGNHPLSVCGYSNAEHPSDHESPECCVPIECKNNAAESISQSSANCIAVTTDNYATSYNLERASSEERSITQSSHTFLPSTSTVTCGDINNKAEAILNEEHMNMEQSFNMSVGDFFYLRAFKHADVGKELWVKGNWRDPTIGDPYGQDLVNQRIRVWWDGDNCYYDGVVESYIKPSSRNKLGKHKVRYFIDGLVAEEILADISTSWHLPPCVLNKEEREALSKKTTRVADEIQTTEDSATNSPMHWQIEESIKREPEHTQRNCIIPNGSTGTHAPINFSEEKQEILRTLRSFLVNQQWENRQRKWLDTSFKFIKTKSTEDVMFVRMGRILDIKKNSEGNPESIIVVQLWYPQDTYHGFDSHVQGLAEVFEACQLKPNTQSDGDESLRKLCNEKGRLKDNIPISIAILDLIEEVKLSIDVTADVPLSPARVHPCQNGRTNPCASKAPESAYQSDYFISHRYCLELDVYFPMKNSTDDLFANTRPASSPTEQPSVAVLSAPKAKLLLRKTQQSAPPCDRKFLAEFCVCHRCRRVDTLRDAKRCSLDKCGRYFCTTCIYLLCTGDIPSNSRIGSDWIGPCCSGNCPCVECKRKAAKRLSIMWNAWIKSSIGSSLDCTSNYTLPAVNATDFCSFCAESTASSSALRCNDCGSYNHHNCKGWTENMYEREFRARGLYITGEDNVLPSKEHAVAHGIAIQINKMWRPATIVAYNVSNEQHQVNVYHKNADDFTSCWLDLNSEKVCWAFTGYSDLETDTEDDEVKDQRSLRKALRQLKKCQVEMNHADSPSDETSVKSENSAESFQEVPDSQMWTCWSCSMNRLNKFQQELCLSLGSNSKSEVPYRLGWRCSNESDKIQLKSSKQWTYGIEDCQKATMSKKGRKGDLLLLPIEKLLNKATTLPLQSFSLPDSFFSIDESEIIQEIASIEEAPKTDSCVSARRSTRSSTLSQAKSSGYRSDSDMEDDTDWSSMCARCRPHHRSHLRSKIYNGQYIARAALNLDTSGSRRPGAIDESQGNVAKSMDRSKRLDLRYMKRQGQGFEFLHARKKRLRFGRSSIHCWGVFTEEQIPLADMVIEYRGEIIRNAVADKREKLYKKMKVGSDYMFRIDENFVVDATFKGSLARFVNHSCDPNCYTQIVDVDGTKKIVIYAKRPIMSGEELTYDYKFPLEEKHENRIPCHCRTSKCNGYMN